MKRKFTQRELEVLSERIAPVHHDFNNVINMRTKSRIGLHDSLISLEDLRDVVQRYSFRARITVTARNCVEVLVPWRALRDVEENLNIRKILGTRINVRLLSVWDHVFLWNIVVRKLAGVNKYY